MLTRYQYLLTKLAEEASEIAQIALKTQQFGADEPSVASESTSEGIGSQEGNKAAVGASKPVAKRGRK